ncbi:hypothetical protein CAPTEDRAFT_97468, partial [Capitella teleta]
DGTKTVPHASAIFSRHFWGRFLKEYVPSLILRQKWLEPKRNLKVNDLVLMCNEGSQRGK